MTLFRFTYRVPTEREHKIFSCLYVVEKRLFSAPPKTKPLIDVEMALATGLTLAKKRGWELIRVEQI